MSPNTQPTVARPKPLDGATRERGRLARLSFAKTGAALLSLTVENVSEWILPDDRDSWAGVKFEWDVRSGRASATL
jgi:hypothetical protein